MSTLRVLTVCTGNTCRSPMAAALVAARFGDAGITAEVASVGTLGWNGRPATDHSVNVMSDMGLDISAHRSRKISADDLDVDLILAMTRIHADAVIARDESARARVFLPTELHRLLRSSPSGGVAVNEIRAIGAARMGPTIGRPNEEVADPAGESLDVYRATAARLDRAISGFVDHMLA